MDANISMVIPLIQYTKNSIPYGQAFRLNRFCSKQKDFKGQIKRMKEWFLAKDYPQNVVNKQLMVG